MFGEFLKVDCIVQMKDTRSFQIIKYQSRRVPFGSLHFLRAPPGPGSAVSPELAVRRHRNASGAHNPAEVSRNEQGLLVFEDVLLRAVTLHPIRVLVGFQYRQSLRTGAWER